MKLAKIYQPFVNLKYNYNEVGESREVIALLKKLTTPLLSVSVGLTNYQVVRSHFLRDQDV